VHRHHHDTGADSHHHDGHRHAEGHLDAGGQDSHHEVSTPEEERLALIAYLLDHNRQHAQEIEELAQTFETKKAEPLYEAVAHYAEGNAAVEAFLGNMETGA